MVRETKEKGCGKPLIQENKSVIVTDLIQERGNMMLPREHEVDDLVRGGVLLIEIVNSSKYSTEIKKEALDRMRENVLSVQAGRTNK